MATGDGMGPTLWPQQPGVLGAATDPFAQFGGQQGYNDLTSQWNTGVGGLNSSTKSAAQSAYEGPEGRKSSIMDFLGSLNSSQKDINNRGVQNELARKQGTASIMDMVGQGIRSGNTMLSNRNASDSSASQALAQAYGTLGQRQLGQVGNQYAAENREIGGLQDTFNTQRATGLRKFDEGKQSSINKIASAAEQEIADLNSWAAGKSLPQRLQAEQEIARIRAEAEGILSQYDAELQGAQGINPSSVEDRRRTAFGYANDGRAAENPFNFTTEAPQQFQNTGPSSSGVSVFTQPRRRQEF